MLYRQWDAPKKTPVQNSSAKPSLSAFKPEGKMEVPAAPNPLQTPVIFQIGGGQYLSQTFSCHYSTRKEGGYQLVASEADEPNPEEPLSRERNKHIHEYASQSLQLSTET